MAPALSTVLAFILLWTFASQAHFPFVQFYIQPDLNFIELMSAAAATLATVPLLLLDWLRREAHRVRVFCITFGFMIIALVMVVPQVALHARLPRSGAHDGVTMTEAAVRFLRAGVNPYAVSYRDTPFGRYPALYDETRDNPALNHYVYLPGYLLVSAPFALVFERTTGWFDERLVHLVFLVAAALCLMALGRNGEERRIALVLVLGSPIFFRGFLNGYNDIVTLAPVVAGALALSRHRPRLAATLFGIAASMKQSAWLLLPLFAFFMYWQTNRTKPVGARVRETWARVWPAFVVPAAVIGPFLAWGPADFVADVIRYPAGTLAANFPISGYGAGPLLVEAGAIGTIWDTYAFGLWQAAIGLPLFVASVWWLKRDPTLVRLLWAYAVLLFAFWYFGRWFFDNYVAFVSLLLLTAYLVRPRQLVEPTVRTVG